jgi:SAM-dependent MidA family methyltransferase
VRLESFDAVAACWTDRQANGPIPLPRYMAYCLAHPTLGYYTRLRAESTAQDTVLGKHGDFITSPEISQVFGEVRALLTS